MATRLHLHEHREDKGNMPAHYEDATCRKQRTQGSWEIFMIQRWKHLCFMACTPGQSKNITLLETHQLETWCPHWKQVFHALHLQHVLFESNSNNNNIHTSQNSTSLLKREHFARETKHHHACLEPRGWRSEVTYPGAFSWSSSRARSRSQGPPAAPWCKPLHTRPHLRLQESR